MKASIIQIGNSQEIRIPKPILEQCGFGGEVELEVSDEKIIIQSPVRPRENWQTAFKKMAENGDDKLAEFIQNQWDEEEWE